MKRNKFNKSGSNSKNLRILEIFIIASMTFNAPIFLMVYIFALRWKIPCETFFSYILLVNFYG